MENSVIVKTEKRPSSMLLFWACVLTTVGLGLTVAYCSGIFNGISNIAVRPFTVPDWVVIALPPVLFLHLGIALFFILRENVYTYNGKTVRMWSVVFWSALFLVTAFLPYFVFYRMPIAAYIVSSIATAIALGSTILTYKQTVAGGVVMTIFFIVTALIMVYLGYWAFA